MPVSILNHFFYIPSLLFKLCYGLEKSNTKEIKGANHNSKNLTSKPVSLTLYSTLAHGSHHSRLLRSITSIQYVILSYLQSLYKQLLQILIRASHSIMKFFSPPAFGLILSTSLLENWSSRQVLAAHGRIRNHRQQRKSLIEVKDTDLLEMELGRILSEDVNHWDRILTTSMNPIEAPAISPTNVSTEDPTNKPTLKPSSTVLTIEPSAYATTTKPSSTAPTTIVPKSPSFKPTIIEPSTVPSTQSSSARPVTVSTNVPTQSPTSTSTSNSTVSAAPSSRSTILPRTTWDILQSRPEEFSTLIEAAESVGFDAHLQKPGELTLFAPNNDGKCFSSCCFALVRIIHGAQIKMVSSTIFFTFFFSLFLSLSLSLITKLLTISCLMDFSISTSTSMYGRMHM